jgi:hypothetical protein
MIDIATLRLGGRGGKVVIGLIWLLVGIVWLLTALTIADASLFDRSAIRERVYAQRLEQSAKAGPTPREIRGNAETYWAHYPDVANDPYFGRNGPLGIFGAREHYDRHGRREGRVWPNP